MPYGDTAIILCESTFRQYVKPLFVRFILEEQGKKGPGRPRVYPKRENRRGAPQLVVRVDVDVYEHVTSRPEGARAYLEKLVRKDLEQSDSDSGPLPLSGDTEQAAEA